MDLAISFEDKLVTSLGWPRWSLRTIALLSVAVLIVGSIQLALDFASEASGSGKSNKDSSTVHVSSKFRWFQFQYLSVYLTIMLADWLQGTNMYTLYTSYGVNVGTLFLTGFLSSAVFGTFLGVYVDKWGRKFGCIVFCVLEVGIL
jgi:Sugar-tranasporters, 12 TM